jgi:hypothetical protein
VADYIPYWQLLRDPRWQRKRLEVMERAEFACEECSSATDTLNVHHRHYVKGRKPWEYGDDELRCLCENCHRIIGAKIEEAQQLIGSVSQFYLEEFIGFMRGSIALHNPDECSVLADCLGVSIGVARAYGVKTADVAYARSVYGDAIPSDHLIDVSRRRFDIATAGEQLILKQAPTHEAPV